MKKYFFWFILFTSFNIYSQSDSTKFIIKKLNSNRYIKSTQELYNESNTDADAIIQFDTINFQYAKDYYFKWNVIPLVGSFTIPMADADNNGKSEFYGTSIDTMCSGKIFESETPPKFLYRYNDSIRYFNDITTLKNDGTLNIVGTTLSNKLIFFRQNSSKSLITEPDFIFNPAFGKSHPQIDNATFYDIDGDGSPELLYRILPEEDRTLPSGNEIAKYNPIINNYELVYYHKPSPDYYTFGIVAGDFDKNGKGNFATGSVYGKMYVYEHVNDNYYRVQFEKQLDCYNVFLEGFSNDLDGNGKPELWMAGDFSSSLYGGITRIFVLEPSGNDNYEQVFQIDIRGLFSSIYGNIRVADFDNDGKQEVMVKNAAYMFFFKCRGIKDYYCDFVYKDPMADTTLPGPIDNLGTDVKDLDGDGIPEIISINDYGSNYIPFSLVLKRNTVTNIKGEQLPPSGYILLQNYPNPFNPSTTINYSIVKEGHVKLSVYNLLGNKVSSVVDEFQKAGNYSVNFNADKLASGIYFYKVESGSFSAVKKFILMK